VREHERLSFIAALEEHAVLAADPEEVESIASDPDDDYLVALARASASDLLVSGDRHLLALVDLRPRVVSARQLAAALDVEN
jgi:predicted nucleic acid-binding protein